MGIIARSSDFLISLIPIKGLALLFTVADWGSMSHEIKKHPSKHSSWWRRLSSSSSEDVLIKTNMFALALRLQKTSSKRLGHTSSRCFQDVLPRCFQDVLQKRLQDVFKKYYQVKVFLVTQFQDIFETYSKRFWDVLLRRLSTGGLSRSHFRETYGHCAKFMRVIKISQVLSFHFTTTFSGCTLQRRI